MHWKRTLAAGLASAALTGSAASGAEPADDELRVLVEDLREEVSVLRRKLEVQDEAQAAKGPQPIVGAGKEGFFLRSPDRFFDIRLRGYTHLDFRYFPEDDDGFIDTFLFRRVRPFVEGTIANVVDFRIMPDFANSSATSSGSVVLQDAYLNLKYFPLANLQIGKFKAPFGLERLQSATGMSFVERALPTQLVPNRDLGYMLQGSVQEGLFQYQLAVMNGVSDGSSADVDTANGKDVVARVFAHPFQDRTEGWLSGLGLGFAFGYGRQEDGAPSQYRTQGQQVFFSYLAGTELTENRFRYSPQFTYYWGPFGALGEYVLSSTDVTRLGADETADNQAWQIAASWVLTGENASFRGVIPREDFDPSAGNLGAFELAARYHELLLDDDVFDEGFASATTSAKRATAWGLGVNWYLNRWIKAVLNYDRTTFEDGGGNHDRDAENFVSLRWQLSY